MVDLVHSSYFSLSYRKDFEELFDIIITNALKPGFFSLVPHQRPFRTLGEYPPDAPPHPPHPTALHVPARVRSQEVNVSVL